MNYTQIKQLVTGFLIACQVTLIGYLGENMTTERLVMLLSLAILPYIREPFSVSFYEKEKSVKGKNGSQPPNN